jgi:two-component system OmpR family response regulator
MGALKILIAESNDLVSETLSLALSQSYEVRTSNTSTQAKKLLVEQKPDIIILDLNLPGNTGYNLCSELRSIGVTAPILVLSGDYKLETKIKLFDAGADDYILKPFSLGEFKARVRAIARRIESYNLLMENLHSPKLILDSKSHSVIRDGSQSITLRRKEYAILEHLLKHVGETVSREHLTLKVWRQDSDPWSNAIDVHIKNLRDKIDKPFKRKLVTTVHGAGYRLES